VIVVAQGLTLWHDPEEARDVIVGFNSDRGDADRGFVGGLVPGRGMAMPP